MRVLFSSTSGHGHVLPMVPLAGAFAAAGHEVLWALAERARGLVDGAGIETVAAGADGAEEAALRRAVLSRAASVPGEERAAFVFPRMFGAALTPPMAADLVGIVRGWAPDLLVHEHGELAAPLAGAVCGVPSLTHAFGTAVPVTILADTAERLARLWRDHGLDVPPYAGCFRTGYLDICPPSVQSEPVDHIPGRRQLRPLADARAQAPPDQPLVYVTFGTVQRLPDLLREVVSGLSALPVRLLVAVGPHVDPGAIGSRPAHVQVETWVDQAAVLSRCSAVVSHAGSGTFLGALAHGVPQLCLPQAADQFRNAEGGHRAGAVLVLRPGEVTAAAVRSAVQRLLSEPGFREAAGRVAAEIAAMPSPAAVAAQLADRFRPA